MKASNKLILFKIKGLLSYILYNAILLTFSYFVGRFYQMLLFVLFYNTFQNCFRYRFHADTIQHDPIKAVRLCKIITICVEIIYLMLCKDLDVYIYSNLFIIFLITLLNAILKFSLEIVIIKEDD